MDSWCHRFEPPSTGSIQISSGKQPRQTRSAELVDAILDAAVQVLAKEGVQRFNHVAHAFIRSECGEAEVRVALNDAAPLYRDAPCPAPTSEVSGKAEG